MRKFRVIHAREAFQDCDGVPSLFLAGPTPRDADTASWRPAALQALEDLGFEGVVFTPEYASGTEGNFMQAEQIEWEEEGLKRADAICFWVPRNLGNMPGFTTNIEYGQWKESGKVVLGYPLEAPNMKYMRHYADKLGIPVAHSLEETLKLAVLQVQVLRSPKAGPMKETDIHAFLTPLFEKLGIDFNSIELEWTKRDEDGSPKELTIRIEVKKAELDK